MFEEFKNHVFSVSNFTIHRYVYSGAVTIHAKNSTDIVHIVVFYAQFYTVYDIFYKRDKLI